MQTGDKPVINAMMNFDIEMAKLNLTKKTYHEALK
jgi:hypothetical protein